MQKVFLDISVSPAICIGYSFFMLAVVIISFCLLVFVIGQEDANICICFDFARKPCAVLISHLCPIVCHPGSPPGSSVHEILQARILEWVAMSSSRGSSQPWDRTASLNLFWLAGGFFTTKCHLGRKLLQYSFNWIFS